MNQRSERNLLTGIAAISFAIAAAVAVFPVIEDKPKSQQPAVAVEQPQRGALADWFAKGGVFYLTAGSYGLFGAAASIKALAAHRKLN